MFQYNDQSLQPSSLQKDIPIGVQTNLQLDLYENYNKFKELGIQNTIVIFGSARVKPDNHPLSRYYHETVELAGKLAKHYSGSHFICSGGGPGIMEAANKGAHNVGEKSIGLSMKLEFEKHSNPYIASGYDFKFQTFMLRKLYFIYHMRACIVMPGGYGTLDELFEVLTLIACYKLPKIPVILHGKEFWDQAINLDHLADSGVINANDIRLLAKSESIEDTYNFILKSLDKPQ